MSNEEMFSLRVEDDATSLSAARDSLANSGLDYDECLNAINQMYNSGIIFRKAIGQIPKKHLAIRQLREPEGLVSAYFALVDSGLSADKALPAIEHLRNDGILFRKIAKTPLLAQEIAEFDKPESYSRR